MRKVPNLELNILYYLRKKGEKGLQRREFLTLLETSRTTLYDTLIRLEIKGRIESYHPTSKRRGRPNTYGRICK